MNRCPGENDHPLEYFMDRSFSALKHYLDSQPDFSGLILSDKINGDDIEIHGHFPDRPKSFSYSWKLGQLDPADGEWQFAVAKYIRAFILEV